MLKLERSGRMKMFGFIFSTKNLIIGLAVLTACTWCPDAAYAAPEVSATKDDSLIIDDDADGRADPGDTLQYTITIRNTGDQPGTDVQFDDTIDENTQVVPGTIRVTPIAIDDAYTAVGNTQLVVDQTNGLLANDVDPDDPILPRNDMLTVVSADTTGIQGEVVLNSDGSFTYTPPAGAKNIIDTFAYLVQDPDGLLSNEVGWVSVTVNNDLVWYVANDAGDGGDGRSISPFNSLAAAEAASGENEYIFIYEGDGDTTNQDRGITLKNGQILIGQGVDLVVDEIVAVEATAPAHITHTAGDAVTLANGNVIRGIMVDSPDGASISGTGISGLTVETVDLAGNGIRIQDTVGAATFQFSDLTVTEGTGPIDLENNPDATFNFTNLNVSTSSSTGFLINNSGTVSVAGMSQINATGGAAVDMTDTALSMVFEHLTSINSPNTGISLTNVSGAFTVTGTTTIANPTGIGIDIFDGNAAITMAEVIITDSGDIGILLVNNQGDIIFNSGSVTGSAGAGLSLSDNTGLIDLTGVIFADNGGGIQINGNSGNITIDGGAITNAATGIDIINAGGTITFFNADISGISGTVFSISGGAPIIVFNGNITNSVGGLVEIDSLAAGGSVTFQNGTVSATGGLGVNISNSQGNVTFNSNLILGTSDNRLTGNALTISNNTGIYTFSDLSVFTSGGVGLFANGGEVAVGTGVIDTINALGVDVSNTILSGRFDTVDVTNNNGGGVRLVNNTGGNTEFNSLTATTTNGAGLEATNAGAVQINSGSLASSNGAAIDVDDTRIEMTLTSLSSSDSSSQGIDLTNLHDGSTFDVSGPTTITNAGSEGIRIDGLDTGADVDLDFGDVDIQNRNEIGILVRDADGAVDYGDVLIPNPKGAGGYGIRVEESSAAVVFARAEIYNPVSTVSQMESVGIPSNEGNGDGIFLKNNSGSFTLNGGIIQNAGGDGIDIRNSQNITLKGVTIDNPGNDGIQAINMIGNNTFSGGTIIKFVNQGDANGITVIGTIDDAMSLTVSSSRFSNEGLDGGNAGISVEARVNYEATLEVDDVGGNSGDSIFENISGSAVVTAAIGNDNSTMTTRIRDSIFRNARGALGNNGIDIGSSGNAMAGFLVENNTLSNLVEGSTFGGTVSFGSTSSKPMTGKIRNNDLDDTNGSAFGAIIDGFNNSFVDVTLGNNTADDVGRFGLRVRLDDTASGIVRARNNNFGTVSPVGNDSGTRDGIEIRSRDDSGYYGDYFVILQNNQVIINGSIGKAADIDAEDNAAIYLAVTDGNVFRNDGSGPEFDAETEDPGSEVCLKLTGHTSGTFDLTESAGDFKVENLATIATLNPGAVFTIVGGIENSPGCPVHPAEPADP